MLPQYSMMSAISTTLVFGLIFLFLSGQNGKLYMSKWGVCWIIYSLMFSLDFLNLSEIYPNPYYIVERQALSLLGSMLFLYGTHNFFQVKPPKFILLLAPLSLFTITMSGIFEAFFEFIVVPNIMFSSLLLIWSGCMFISYTWTQNIPEKMIASFLIIAWAIFINHFGLTRSYIGIAIFNYFIGLFTVNLLILFLMIIHFKKTRFILVKREDQYRLLVENSSDSMFLYSYERDSFRYISPSAQALLGLTLDEIYISPKRFFENVRIETESLTISELLNSPIKSPIKAVLCLLRDGQPYKYSEMHALPIRNAFGITTAVHGILRDITKRKQTEESLEASEAARKELIESISHELRTPITLIQGYIEGMLNQVIPPSSVQTYLNMIHAKTMTLNSLLDDLIQVSYFTSQTLDYKYYEIDAFNFFKSTIAQMEFQVVQSGRIFYSENHLKANMTVILDASRIEQVILNLVSNSIRHTPHRGKISITCRRVKNSGVITDDLSTAMPEGEIIFTVSDTGQGVHPDDLPHLFERKFRGRNSQGVTTGAGNSGLGLYISLQIIRHHSGKIWVENIEGGGASFSFSIPYYAN